MIIYDEPAEVYHAAAAIGSSDLRAYIRSPQLFRDMMDGLVQRESPALLFGTASHMALLEPERYAATVAVKPEGMSFATTDGKDWRDAHKGKLIVKAADARHLEFMHARMPAEVRKILATGKSEVTVRTNIGALACQCRVDCWDIPGRMKYDLKTIRAIESVESAIFKLGYHLQDRYYSRVIAAETGEKAPSSRLLFVESQPPYRWRIVELDLDFVYLAEAAIDEALAGIAAREKSGCWDDPADLHLVASPPAWANDDDMNDDDEEVA